MPRKLIPEEVFRSRRNAQMRAAEEKLCKELDELFGKDEFLTEDNIEDVLEGIPVLAVIPEIPSPLDLPSIDALCQEISKGKQELDRWIKAAMDAIDKEEKDPK